MITTIPKAALVAGLGAAIPSTLHALATGGDVAEATRAAGTLLVSVDASPARRLVAGLSAHAGLSVGWAAVLAPLIARSRRPLAAGALLGAGVAALDLSLARSRWPSISALPTVPQIADHVAFGLLVAVVVRRAPR